jgi:thiamine biosynthesis lipoprotein
MPTQHLQFQAIGTQWTITVNSASKGPSISDLINSIHARIEAFDVVYSRFRPDSLVSSLAQKAGRYPLPADGYKLLHFYEQLYAATAGQVTPLIGQVMTDAGYDASYSFRQQPLHSPPRWEDTLTYDQSSITMHRPALLDFGAAGKGYLVDIIGALLERSGVTSYLLNAGGDIRHRSSTPETAVEIGLENPLDQSEIIGIARLGNRSLCASAGSKRAWGNFHHIIDPQKLSSPRNTLATWVIADDTMTADGLATALFFADQRLLQQLSKMFSFSYAILDSAMELHYAKDFPVRLL